MFLNYYCTTKFSVLNPIEKVQNVPPKAEKLLPASYFTVYTYLAVEAAWIQSE